mmetsp:Transcript_35969/g.82608  ORF Transcript_35969/g.82608 Transcript_35969/m.82608 type:complete len:347 (+) Transcript_35969:400-1440(+)
MPSGIIGHIIGCADPPTAITCSGRMAATGATSAATPPGTNSGASARKYRCLSSKSSSVTNPSSSSSHSSSPSTVLPFCTGRWPNASRMRAPAAIPSCADRTTVSSCSSEVPVHSSGGEDRPEADGASISWSISDASLIKNAFGCGKFCECSGMCLLRHSAVLFAQNHSKIWSMLLRCSSTSTACTDGWIGSSTEVSAGLATASAQLDGLLHVLELAKVLSPLDGVEASCLLCMAGLPDWTCGGWTLSVTGLALIKGRLVSRFCRSDAPADVAGIGVIGRICISTAEPATSSMCFLSSHAIFSPCLCRFLAARLSRPLDFRAMIVSITAQSSSSASSSLGLLSSIDS